MTTVDQSPSGPVAAQATRTTDRSALMTCAWAGPVCCVLAGLGLVVIAGIIPPQSPTASAVHIAHWFSDHATRVRIGVFVTMCGVTLFVPFGAALAIQLQRIEKRPLMTYIQVACVAIATIEGVIAMFLWGAVAFRAGQIDPATTHTLNDVAWFAFMFDVPPFSLWVCAVGYLVLRDDRPNPIFPRWTGYFNFWMAFLFLPADSMAYFKTGPFAWNGLLCLYVPVGLFFVWVAVMSPLLMRAIRREVAGVC